MNKHLALVSALALLAGLTLAIVGATTPEINSIELIALTLTTAGVAGTIYAEKKEEQ